jgi:hypothetical protein
MNVRRRSGLMDEAGGTVKNTVTTRKPMITQAKEIKNTVAPPSPIGVSKIRGTVTSPSGGPGKRK